MCRFHGGGTRAARAAGLRRYTEDRIRAQVARWETARRQTEAARKIAMAPWAHEVNPTSPVLFWEDPAMLRRVASEMRKTARYLMSVARGIEVGFVSPDEAD